VACSDANTNEDTAAKTRQVRRMCMRELYLECG
jgi:hypothetical protein